MLTSYVIFREGYSSMLADSFWQTTGQVIPADSEERAVRTALREGTSSSQPSLGTYAAVPTDELAQFMDARRRLRASVHIDEVAKSVNA